MKFSALATNFPIANVKTPIFIYTERRADLEEEKKLEDSVDGRERSFKARYDDVKGREESTAGNFADLIRYKINRAEFFEN